MKSTAAALLAGLVVISLSLALHKCYLHSTYDQIVLYKEPRPTPDIDVRKKVKQNLNETDSTYQSREKHLNEIWDYVYKLQYICSDIEEVGGKVQMDRDGFYPVCKEPKFWKMDEYKSNKK